MSIWKPISSFALVSILALALASCSPALNGSALTAGSQAQSLASVIQAKSAGSTAPQAQTGSPVTGGITVVGTGVVSASPNVAQTTVGIETMGADVKQAVDDNNTKMTELLKSLKSAGIDAKDIRTTNFSIYADRQPSIDQAGAQGSSIYHVTNQVEVTIRDLSKVSEILDIAVASGANNIYGVNFSISDQSKLQDEARTKAVADAKARAEKLAQLQGLTLGSVIAVEEVNNYAQPLYAADALGKGGAAPIESGSLQVSLSIQVTYAIK